jgi:hypothetical protein
MNRVSSAKPLKKWLLAAKGTRGQFSRGDAQETLCDISRWEQMHMITHGQFLVLGELGVMLSDSSARIRLKLE